MFRILLILLFLPAGFIFGAQELRDEVVFKEGVTLPVYAKSVRVPCEVVSETPESIQINVSNLKGIADLRVIARGDLEQIIRGDRSGVTLATLKPKLEPPSESQAPDYYKGILEGELVGFLKVNAGKPEAEEASRMARVLSSEMNMVKAGWRRVGPRWFGPEDAAEFQQMRELNTFLEKLSAIQKKVMEGDYKCLIGLDEEMNRFKSSIYFPDLVDGLKLIIAPAHEAAPPSLRTIANLPVGVMRQHINIFLDSRNVLEAMHRGQDFDHRTWNEKFSKLATTANVLPDLDEFQSFMVRERPAILGGLVALIYLGNDGSSVGFDQASGTIDSICSRLNMPVEKKSEYRLKIEEIRAFSIQFKKLKDDQNWPGLADLVPPMEDTRPVLKFREELRRKAGETMEKSRLLIEEIRRAVNAGDYEAAIEPARKRAALWAQDPEADKLQSELLSVFKARIAEKKKDESARLLLVLKAGWGYGDQILEAEKSMEYTRSVSVLDNMSVAMMLSIGFVALLAVVLLRWGVKHFASGE